MCQSTGMPSHRNRVPRWPLYLGLGLLLLVLSPTLFGFQPPLLLQLTGSEPRGVYWLRALPEALSRGTLVTLGVPDAVADLVFRQGWLPRSWMRADVVLVKSIAALEGDTVCIADAGVFIHGEHVGPVFRELGGIELPVLRGCWTLAAGGVFLFSNRHDHAFDGRYFGVVHRDILQRVAVPLLTWSHE
jgi:conjugative transfer signal peptidase TraF